MMDATSDTSLLHSSIYTSVGSRLTCSEEEARLGGYGFQTRESIVRHSLQSALYTILEHRTQIIVCSAPCKEPFYAHQVPSQSPTYFLFVSYASWLSLLHMQMTKILVWFHSGRWSDRGPKLVGRAWEGLFVATMDKTLVSRLFQPLTSIARSTYWLEGASEPENDEPFPFFLCPESVFAGFILKKIFTDTNDFNLAGL